MHQQAHCDESCMAACLECIFDETFRVAFVSPTYLQWKLDIYVCICSLMFKYLFYHVLMVDAGETRDARKRASTAPPIRALLGNNRD